MHATRSGLRVALWIATAVAAFGIGWLVPPPHEPPAPDDLAASLRSALSEGDVIERDKRTASLLERLGPDVVLEVAALYERMIPVINTSELGAFFVAWARFDPLGALDYLLAWPLTEMEAQQQTGVAAVFRAWAQREPLAARLAATQISADHPNLRRELIWGLVTGWAHSPAGQEGLADFIARLPPTRPRDEYFEVVVRELIRGGEAEAALGWADPVLRDKGYEPLFKRDLFTAAANLAAQWDPERAAAWVVEHSGADYAERGVDIVVKQWSRRDGAAAMAWLGEQPAGERRDQAVSEAYGRWWKAEPRQARKWLNTEETTAFHDPALGLYAQRIAAERPEQALGFCERISDTARQQSCLEQTAKSWYERDAVAAEAWIQQSSLDDEARGRVRKVLLPKEREVTAVQRITTIRVFIAIHEIIVIGVHQKHTGS